MGLYASFVLDDFAYPTDLVGIGEFPIIVTIGDGDGDFEDEDEDFEDGDGDGGDGAFTVVPGYVSATETVDYSNAFQACMDTFMNIALELVPVDTGYLRDSIGVNFLGNGIEFYATAEYAQYVEFGTGRMNAQEFFQPALEEAMAVFHEKAQIAIDWADEMLQGMVQGLMDASMAFSESMGMGFMGGIMTFAVVGFVFFPVLLFAYGVMDALGDAFFGDSGIGRLGDDGVPEIEII